VGPDGKLKEHDFFKGDVKVSASGRDLEGDAPVSIQSI
jgi:hypothetical protein